MDASGDIDATIGDLLSDIETTTAPQVPYMGKRGSLGGNTFSTSPALPVSRTRQSSQVRSDGNSVLQQANGYFHGSINRGQAETLLKSGLDGTYLVRSSTSSPGDYVLSVKEAGRFSHYIISDKKGSYIIGGQSFIDVPTLIIFYHKHLLESTPLKYPVEYGKPPPNAHEQVAYAARRSISGSSGSSPTSNSIGVRNPSPALPCAPSQAAPDFLFAVRSLYKFTPRDEEDLGFEVGEIMYVLDDVTDPEWWTARSQNGDIGVIPSNYTEVLEGDVPPPLPTTRRPSDMMRSTTSRGSPQQKGHLRRTQSLYGPQVQPRSSASDGGENLRRQSLLRTSTEIAVPAYKVRAIMDRPPNNYDDTALSFKVGDIITVTNSPSTGIWEGSLNGRSGHFPSSYIERSN